MGNLQRVGSSCSVAYTANCRTGKLPFQALPVMANTGYAMKNVKKRKTLVGG